MIFSRSIKYSQALGAFFAILLIFLVTIDVFIVKRQRQEMQRVLGAHMERELDLVGTFMVEPLLRHDFSRIEQFVRMWGEKHDDIVSFTATAPTGFKFGRYEREIEDSCPVSVSLPIKHDGKHLLDLEMVKDMAAEEKTLAALHKQLVLRSVGMVLILGVVAWLLFKRLAIQPLESEIERRERLEDELRRARNELEDRVAQRTSQLARSNRLLEDEVEERRQAEEHLASEKERLSVTLRSIGDGVITTDIDGRIVMINRMAEGLTGWSQGESVGRPLIEVFQVFEDEPGGIQQNPIPAILEAGRAISLSEGVLLARNGTDKIVANSGAQIRDRESEIIGAVVVFRDITENKRMEDELLKARKLESVGVLAGGIAHDFNNILSGILGNISLAAHIVGEEAEVYPILHEAEKASGRARGLTQQLLTFSRGGEPVREAALIAEVIRDSAEFILHGSKVLCEYDFADDLWLADIDTGQVSQVIQNIISNASEAMVDGGTIRISCENFVNRDEGPLPIALGRFIKMTIQDNGPGIPPELLDRIFDPYFSTKSKGSGLGLAITHSIVAKHEGHISVGSTPGQGACFTIFLPASEQAGVDKPAAEGAEKKVARDAPPYCRGRVLLMDDEELVCNVVCKMLLHLGYEAETAGDGYEALEMYDQARAAGIPFDIVIMDLTIPSGMGGGEAIGRLLELDPKAKAIVASGYSTDPIMANYRKNGFVGAVGKPFRLDDLGETLVRVMEL